MTENSWQTWFRNMGWKIKHINNRVAGQTIRNKTLTETQEQEN
jgi:hypothetical protein